MALKKGGSFIEGERALPVRGEDPGALKAVSIRMHARRIKALERFFDSRGLGFSAGVRSILYEWCDKNGVR